MSRINGNSFARRFILLLVIILIFSICSSGQEPQTVFNRKSASILEKCLLKSSCPERRKAALDLATLDLFPFLLKEYKHADETMRELIVEGIYGSAHGRKNESVIEFMSGIAFHLDVTNKFSDTT